MDKKVTKDTWYIATDGDIYHYGYCPKGTQLSTGLPTVEEYDNEADYLERLAELGIEIQENNLT